MPLLEIPFSAGEAGRIIGAKGATVRQLEDDSGARVKVDTENNKVIINGSAESLLLAEAAVYEVLGGRGVAVVRDVDEMAVGFVTKNDWLAELELQMNVTVHVDRRCLRVVPNDGYVETAREAVQAIEEKIQEMSQLKEVVVECPSGSVQQLTSDRGLSQLTETRGLTMEVRKDDKGTSVMLRGLRGIVEEAESSIQTLLKHGGARDFVPIITDLLTDVSQQKLDDFQGDLIQHVETPFGVQVEYSVGGTSFTILGEGDAVPQAKIKLQELLQFYFQANCAFIQIHPGAVQWVCGPDDRYIVKVQSRDLQVSIDKQLHRLWACGKERSLDFYCKRVEGELNKWHSTNKEIYLEDSRCIGRLVGPRGENIRKMQEKSGCIIAVDDLVIKIQAEDYETLCKGEREVQQAITDFYSKPQQSAYRGGHRDYDSPTRGRYNDQQGPTRGGAGGQYGGRGSPRRGRGGDRGRGGRW